MELSSPLIILCTFWQSFIEAKEMQWKMAAVQVSRAPEISSDKW